MEPGVGVVAAAAARAFGHRKPDSRQGRKRQPALRSPGRSNQPPNLRQQTDGRLFRSRCRVSRCPNMEFRALRQRLSNRSTAVPRNRGPMSAWQSPRR